ncbi:hypothetical protein A5634_05255 [Mycobacterium asiaticum]|uniref:DUF3060 domain-containing protein n=1 Tax=Mycobacterium asiaticum TaxID=1790 RepID=A0A1A3NQK6_MYCAS|nr:DUF3060 domain-containing protein [Mycobacterium asiaticum]OBK23645.1 hypothetical protein A5634_05255 [Mycobacterium asiaticum]
MNPEDDPEARIRELEQPLANRAHELGDSGDYSYPPPPPGPVPPPMQSTLAPPSYGYESAYPGATPRSSSGMRWFWILAGVGILGVLLLVGGIAAYAARQFAHGDLVVSSPTETTSANASSGSTAPGTEPPTGKTHAPSSGPSPSAGAPAGEPVIVSGINDNKTIACSDNTITISGISNHVVLTGHCATVNVSGLNNIVTVDAVDTIEASGLNNKVTYHSGSPKISKSGSGNEVEQG